MTVYFKLKDFVSLKKLEILEYTYINQSKIG